MFFRSAWALFLLAAVGAAPPRLHADDDEEKVDYVAQWEERNQGVGWNFSPGLNGGYTSPLHGYDDYEGLGNAGLDLYMRPPVPQFPRWFSKFMFRLSADYFPMQVPTYVVGVTEDIYAVSGTLIWRFMNFESPEHEQWIPFVGGGLSFYWDSITLDTPASGKISGTQKYLGATASAGLLIPCVGSLRLVPEVRYHTSHEVDQFWASHVSYKLGAVLWFPAKVEE